MVKRQQVHNEIINLTGGLNEQISNLELSPGELIFCQNYIERDDLYSGYESILGYERFNGRTKPSSIIGTPLDHAAREFARDIIEVPTGSGICRGIFLFNDEVYTCRNEAQPATYKNVFKESTTGWEQVTAFDTKLNAGGKVRTAKGIFSYYNNAEEVLVIVDGVSNAQIWNGTTVTEIPEPDTNIGFPTHVSIYKNRLILVFPKGNIVFSSVGDPTDYDTATNTAGRVKAGGEITNVQETKGGILVITTLTSTKLMYYGGTSDDETFIFKLDTFSDSLGAYEDTLKPLVGTTMLADVSGVTTLTAIDAYGDFRETNLTKKVQQSFDSSKIVAAVTDKEKGRYLLYFSDASTSFALVLSLKGQKVKSITKLVPKVPIAYITNVMYADGTERIFFGDYDGMVYENFIGTSMDGESIDCYLRTSFYSYKSPRIWKRFSKIHFETFSEETFQASVRPRYNYDDTSMPVSDPQEGINSLFTNQGYQWGVEDWNDFTWGRGTVDNSDLYISGYGSNMGIEIKSSSAYNLQHVFYNLEVNFTFNTQHL